MTAKLEFAKVPLPMLQLAYSLGQRRQKLWVRRSPACGRNGLKSSRVLVGVAILLANVAWAQSWETVFTLPPPADPPYYDRWPARILQDPFGPPESGNSRLIVGMRYDDQDLYEVNLTNGTSQGQILTDPLRGVVGLAYDPVSGSLFATSDAGWQVRRSSDQGASWTLLDTFAGDAAETKGLTLDATGNIYVCGNTNADNGTSTWFVRKSSDQGVTWSTVDRLSSASAESILFVPGSQGGLFVVGYRVISGGYTGWTVKRSRDEGATWQIVDSFVRSGKGTAATAITSDVTGRLYVAGLSSPDPARWEVRMSENGGSTWRTISPANATSQINGVAWGLVVDWSGTLFVAGTLDSWAVARRNPDGVWQEPEFPFGTETGWVASQATAVTMDTAGNVLVAGRVRSGWPETVTSSLVIQKLAASVLPPLVVRRSGNSVVVSWPAALSGVQLEWSGSAEPGATWSSVTLPPTLGSAGWSVELPADISNRFFRLRKL